ncbi:MAG: alpha/beta hydrolase family protein [Terriglobales bacterium]
MKALARMVGVVSTALLVSAMLAAQRPSPVGRWQGALQPAPGVSLRLQFDITSAAGGGLRANLRSLDQGGQPLAASAAEASADKLTLTFAAIPGGGSFTGTLSADGQTLTGVWTQGAGHLPLTLHRLAAKAAPLPQIERWVLGGWQGTLQPAPGVALRLRLDFSQHPAGGLSASLVSLDQGNSKQAASQVTITGGQVTVAFPAYSFEGMRGADGSSINGQWKQSGQQWPLLLKRVAAAGQQPAPAVPPDRPQRPMPPFPYRSVNVTVPSVNGIKLAGTLTVPDGAGPFPAAILIAGSGPNNRNETVFGHNIFWVLADHLSRHGIAVLRMDKRGIGHSGGDAMTATTLDYVRDVEADLAFLRTQPPIAPLRIGLIGHSEGGLIAPVVASAKPVAFVVLMAGPGESGEDVIVDQVEAMAAASGAPQAQVAEAGVEEREILNVVRSAPTPAAVPAALRTSAASGKIPQGNYQSQMAALASPWYHEFLSLDPTPYLQKLRCPVLAMIGSKDVQVPAATNLPKLRLALAQDARAEVVEMPGLNHLFQPASTGLPNEYATIPTTIAPAALERITAFITSAARG